MTQQVRLEHGALFDLSARTKLRVTGDDRLRFLNGQVSNDLRKASAHRAIYACVLNAKGKLNADVFVHVEGDAFLIDAEPELREQLAARLERYVIADDVEIVDVSDEFALLHMIGANISDSPSGGHRAEANRFATTGTDLWFPRASYKAVLQESAAKQPLCDDVCAETFRIERGVPRWARELSEEIIPTEANLESSAIDYAKGCYIGQEVISRVKMSGQTNKRLCGLVATNDGALRHGMRLTSNEGQKDVGWITSVATSARIGRQIALGFVKRGFNDPGTLLEAVTPELSARTCVEIVPLPFA